ncbi:hypothetical protein M231_01416 [Tremella mesenterica]|uniref:Major facilitator superfamily (MFS) profile domain-containing protein n=1 Tax=Tremella mesenterica TaxID=5217 RepID=A0A4Q1BTC8_TREME|nr:hypothetical protein M231_01416 [Tremella mesenterica]
MKPIPSPSSPSTPTPTLDPEKAIPVEIPKNFPNHTTSHTKPEETHYPSDKPDDQVRPPFPALQTTTTTLSTRSARVAAEALSTFPTHPANPLNWPRKKKWRMTMLVALTGFISTCGSSIGVPGIHGAMDDFGEKNLKIGVGVTTYYVLGLGAGPFIFAPISELYGRQTAYQISQFLYVFFCLGAALAPNMAGLLILRFLCGVTGSSGPALGVATCADIWIPSERGRPISIYAIGPMAGPVLGSILGYWILYGSWRWLYGTITILAAANYVLLILFAEETYAPAIEKVLRYRIEHPLSDPKTWGEKLSPRRIIHDLGWMKEMVSRQDAKTVFGRAFSRPPRLLFGNPVCFIFSAYYAYIYAIIYVFLVSVPLLYGSPPFSRPGLFSYQWPQYTLSLAYLGLAVGFAIAVVVASNAQDRIYKYLSKKNGIGGQPEYRLVLTQTGMIILPVGLFIFGWTAHAEVHWIAPQIGQCLIALGLMMAFNSIQNFIVDAFFPFSAAGIAAATAMRSVIACVLPIFSPDLFYNLGWGYGATLLACVALIAVPAPALMFIWGRQLREKYKFRD